MKQASFSEKLFVMTLAWLIPGYGFLHHGKVGRAALFFFTLQGTFLVGAWFYGSVLLPDFNASNDGFNLVAILTFITQMCNGGLGIVSLLPELTHGKTVFLPYNETNQWSDLGAFYLLVSGGMNYYVLTSTYDHFYGSKQPAEENEEANEGDGVEDDPGGEVAG